MLQIHGAVVSLARYVSWLVVSFVFCAALWLTLVIKLMTGGEPALVSIMAVGSVLSYLVVVCFYCIAPGHREEEEDRPLSRLLWLWVPWTVYGLVTGSMNQAGFFQLLVYSGIPLALTMAIKRSRRQEWQATDFLVILFLWLPFDAGLLSDIWPWPGGSGAYPVNTVLALCLGFFLYNSHRRIPGTGIPFKGRGREDLRDLLILFSFFCLIVIPTGILTGFITFAVSPDILSWVLGFPGILLFIALPEEFLFRGLMLNYFTGRFPQIPVSVWLVVSSVIFGLSHLNNPPLYDWRYLLLSTVGGLFYGVAYLKRRNLFLPVMLHTLVDFVWFNLFSGRA